MLKPRIKREDGNRNAVSRRIAALAILCCLAVLGSAVAAQSGAADRLAQAQSFLDRGEPGEALREIDSLGDKEQSSAEALLIRSTALIMLGDAAGGYKELRRALKADPKLRQGWLNLAGLEIAERRYDDAEKALRKARELDPQAADSYLNLGAVAVLRNQSAAAAEHFATYLELEEDRGQAFYLVAANYALAGNAVQAVEHLRQAIAEDERLRLQARSDDRFAALTSPEYSQLLTTDSYTVPADHRQQAAAFQRPYTRQDPQLVYSLAEALKELEIPYDPKIEATQNWALIWGDMRIKVWNQANGTGVISLSAPPERFTDDAWHRRTQELFRLVHEKLAAAEQSARLRPR